MTLLKAIEAARGAHQSQMKPEDNKFHKGNGVDQKHYWLTPPDVYESLNEKYNFDFDPCPFPKPDDFDGLTCEWGQSSYVNPPFGSIMHNGKKKGATAWARKAIEENKKGKRVVLVHPMDKWVLMMIAAGAKITNLGDVKWLATEDGSAGKGTGRHIACFVLEPPQALSTRPTEPAVGDEKRKDALIWIDSIVPLLHPSDLEKVYTIKSALQQPDKTVEVLKGVRGALVVLLAECDAEVIEGRLSDKIFARTKCAEQLAALDALIEGNR